jgi:glutathione S-transferase
MPPNEEKGTEAMPMLHWSPRSPYVRKVMVALHEKGLADTVEIVRTPADPMVPHEDLMRLNPLSKIPTLEREDGPPIFDSRVICEWADMKGRGPALFPGDPEQRMLALRDEAIGTGLLDVAVPWLVETRMRPPEQRSATLIATFRRKMNSVADWLDQRIDEIATRPFDMGHLAVGVAFCYLDFRFADENWANGRPALAAWHAEFRKRPSVVATEFRDDPRPTA